MDKYQILNYICYTYLKMYLQFWHSVQTNNVFSWIDKKWIILGLPSLHGIAFRYIARHFS